jgi:hypothetical protein
VRCVMKHDMVWCFCSLLVSSSVQCLQVFEVAFGAQVALALARASALDINSIIINRFGRCSDVRYMCDPNHRKCALFSVKVPKRLIEKRLKLDALARPEQRRPRPTLSTQAVDLLLHGLRVHALTPTRVLSLLRQFTIWPCRGNSVGDGGGHAACHASFVRSCSLCSAVL